MSRRCCLLTSTLFGLLSLLVILDAHAQAFWYEIPVPSDSVFVTATKDERFLQQYFIRSTQQPLYIQPSVSGFERIYIRTGADSTLIYNGSPRSSGVLWYSPPATPGAYELTARVYTGSQSSYTYTFELVVVPPAQRAFTDGQFLDAPITYTQTVRRANTILLWQGGSASMDRPLMMVEGIDAAQQNSHATYYAIGLALFQAGQVEGADVMILDFADGGRDMVLNANVVIDAVNMVRRLKTDPYRGIDLAGVSMGGVVARYALAKMEEQQLPHDVARFASMDAPQQGAVIDAELQRRIADHNRNYGAEVPLTLLRVAGAQLLKRNRFDFNYPTYHNAFYSQIRALNGGVGYPRLTENVGVSFGAPTANPNAGREWLELRLPSLYPNDHFDVVGDIAVAGSYLPRDLTDIWGKISWMGLTLTYELDRKRNPTFIPFESALDLQSGLSAFDAPLLHPSVPSFHNVVPTNVRTELLLRLGYGVPAPTQVSVSGPGSLAAGETGYWKATISPGPGNGYAHVWEYRIVCADPPGGAFAAGAAADEKSTDLDAKSPNEKDPGGGTTNAVNCGEWHFGGVTAKFAYRSSSAATLDIRVRASGGGGSVTSPAKRVYIGGGGSNLGASQASSSDEVAESEASQYAFGLEPSRPHPMKPEGGIVRFALPETAFARLVVYDLLGREVRQLYAAEATAGAHEVRFEVVGLPAGVYVLRLSSGAHSATRQLVVAH